MHFSEFRLSVSFQFGSVWGTECSRSNEIPKFLNNMVSVVVIIGFMETRINGNQARGSFHPPPPVSSARF